MLRLCNGKRVEKSGKATYLHDAEVVYEGEVNLICPLCDISLSVKELERKNSELVREIEGMREEVDQLKMEQLKTKGNIRD